MRVKITLECTVCKSRNYVEDKNKQKHPNRVERKKFCKVCNMQTMHKETR
ncbi:MAG: 50S ribosomal protein L33 [Calditrichia bacterium]|nr:50S ribosomal protein L33 [Calditrichota bacterium]MCB0270128.1 50S ribosomal protein L33 [Calditrichota bacterium]MCB9067054.1 50S ribosomal protein L33 [Calditrichia bacterium]